MRLQASISEMELSLRSKSSQSLLWRIESVAGKIFFATNIIRESSECSIYRIQNITAISTFSQPLDHDLKNDFYLHYPIRKYTEDS
jgi:hypothetical protein